MSVRLDGDVIRLDGDCHVEEAEALVRLLQEDRERQVDLGACRQLHSALAQVLIAFGAVVCGRPDDPFLRELVLPNFRAEPTLFKGGGV
jgi:hypothetical protein